MSTLLLFIPLGFCLFILSSYTRIARRYAFLTLLTVAIVSVLYYVRQPSVTERQFVLILSATGSFMFMTALALRLWACWVGERETEAERQPGRPGIRAWFSAPNIAVCVSIIVLSWRGFDVSPVLTGAVLAALLAAGPLLRSEAVRQGSDGTLGGILGGRGETAPDLSIERDKIFAMISAGKITAEEGAELLQALGASTRQPAQQKEPMGRRQRLLLIGSGLVLLGFFLPWFTLNPKREAERMFGDVTTTLEGSGVHFPEPQLSLPGVEIFNRNVVISGGDVKNNLGWAALLLALGAAVLPNLGPGLDPALVRSIRLVALGVGSLILLYLVSGNLRFVSIGLVLAVAGYALQIAGSFTRAQSSV